MARFKHVPDTFLYRKMCGYWKNMIRNFNGECTDDDFFAVVRNGFDHDKAVELIRAAYTADEMNELENARLRCNRIDLSDPLTDVFTKLWNQARARNKCKIILDAICEYMELAWGNGAGDPFKGRVESLRKALKLSDLETDILLVAYIRNETYFRWPCRVDNRGKSLYYAMAVDRSYAEVMKALSPKGRLRKFGILDSDWDFNTAAYGGCMDGTDEEGGCRQFYRKCDMGETLPWDYYGELAKKDGQLLKRMLASGRGVSTFSFTVRPEPARRVSRRPWRRRSVSMRLRSGRDPKTGRT